MKKRFYLFSILILFLFNIENINALENNNQVFFYNNNGSNVNSVSTNYDSSTGESYAIFTTYANSYGGLMVYQLSSPLVKNHMYKMFVNVGAANDGGYARLSTKNYIGLGTSINGATTSYINNTISPSFSQAVDISTDKGRGLYFIFTANTNATFIAIPYTSQYNCTNCYQYSYGLDIEDVGDTSGLSSTELNNITNNQTSILQSDINNLQENFDNTIKDTFNDCRPSVNLYNPSETYIVGAHNQDIALNYFYDLTVGETYTFTTPRPWTTINVYDSSNNKLRDYGNIRDSYSQTVTIQEGDSYLILVFNAGNNTNISNYDFTGVQFEKGSKSTTYEPYGQEICKSKLDNLNDTQKETNDKLDDLNDNITNSDTSGASGEASDFFSNFNTDTFGLTSVITAPLELIKSVTSKSCTPLQLTLPFVNKELNLPCLSTIYENHFGSFLTIYRTITFGFVSYWVCIKIFNLVKDFKNPEHDEIEVLDL